MRIRAAITVALASVVVAILMAMPAFAAKGGKDRPYKLSGTQTGTITFSPSCFFGGADPCTFTYELVGPAIGSHLGKSSVFTDNLGSGEENTYTAANGDKLYSKGSEATPPNTVCPEVSGFGFSSTTSSALTFDGGTGRFADASGTAVSVGCIYIDFSAFDDLVFPFYVTYSETGTISY